MTSPRSFRALRGFGLGAGIVGLLILAGGCGDDDDGSQAQRFGVGAACSEDTDCASEPVELRCLDFKGGYCGLADCAGDEDCPRGSACVAHDDGIHYCFLICDNKPGCNLTRPADSEANCSSNVTYVNNTDDVKACVPPSG